MNGKKYHGFFLPFNPLIIITCGVHNQRKRNTLKTRSALTLTIASILSNGGTCKCGFLLLNLKINIFFFFPNSLVLNFANFKLSRNSRNKSHANIKCFTVSTILQDGTSRTKKERTRQCYDHASRSPNILNL